MHTVGDREGRLRDVQIRLFDVAAGIAPLRSTDELEEHAEQLHARLLDVIDELKRVREEVYLVMHVNDIEAGGLEDELIALEARLAEGWKPEARPFADVLADLDAYR